MKSGTDRISGFPVEPWKITETEYIPEALEKNATIFFLGNGYMGIRGGREEADGSDGASHKGLFVNGFYETAPQIYGESAFGFPDKKQAMLNLPDQTDICFYVNADRFSLCDGEILSYSRTLDLSEGLLLRDIKWRSPSGIIVEYKSTRCVSLVRPHCAVLSVQVRLSESHADIRLVSKSWLKTVSHREDKSDPRTGAGFRHQPLELQDVKDEGSSMSAEFKTLNSGLVFACAAGHQTDENLEFLSCVKGDNSIDFTFTGTGISGFKIDRFITCCTSTDVDKSSPLIRAEKELEDIQNEGADRIISEHREHVAGFWERSDLQIEGDDSLQQGIRFNLFSVYQSAGRDGRRNIAAKGLSGEGYEGHYFWDTEIYVLPFMFYTNPGIAGKLLEYRYSILDAARARAEIMNESGALFPWRTINGEEASAYFPAGTAQYHINADIAYGVQKYVEVSADYDFLITCGAEILFETARMWMSLGFFSPEGDSFFINGVTGPDEYTAIVNNNFFTNIMAANNLEYAVITADFLQKTESGKLGQLRERLKLKVSEIDAWRRAFENMYLPYNAELGIYRQDDAFLLKEIWDFNTTPEDKYPLLLHFHPLVIYRHQVLKQPDVVLAEFLLGNRFPPEQKKRDFDYYNAITTGDSSLAPCVQSIMASELGYSDLAYDYFIKTARMDLDDVNGNVSDGVHIAAMGGTWLSIVCGFAGMRDYNGFLSFNPAIPKRWKSLSFHLKKEAEVLGLRLSQAETEYELLEGFSITFSHKGEEFRLKSGESVVIKN